MNVRDLIARLQKVDPEARVFVTRGSEDRELVADDLSANDGPVQTDDSEDYDGPYLAILTWS